MSTSSSEATRPTRSVGSQIFLASFWTVFVISVLSSIYRLANEVWGFSVLQSEMALPSFHRPTLAIANPISGITTFVLFILSCIMLMHENKKLGRLGLLACVLGFAYISVPHF